MLQNKGSYTSGPLARKEGKMKRNGRRTVLKLLVLAGLVLFGAPSAVFSDSEDSFIIAAVFSETGIAALHNKPLIEVIELTVEKINDSGGVLGRKIDLLVLDNKSTPIGAMEAAMSAVAAGATAVIGAHWSSHSLAMAPILEEAGVLMITPASSHPAITRDRKYVFRVSFQDSFQGQAMARYAVESLGIKSAAVLRNVDESYCTTLAGYFKSAFSSMGGKIVLDYSYRGSSTDFSDVIEQLKDINPDAVYIPGYARDSALFMKQARRQGVTSLFLGGDGWDMLEKLVSEEVEGSYQSVPWHPGVPYPQSIVLQQMYEQEHGDKEVNLTAPLAYDAVQLVVAAIQRAKSFEPAKVRDALASLDDFQGATGHIVYDKQGNPRAKDVIIVNYRSGEIVFDSIVKP